MKKITHKLSTALIILMAMLAISGLKAQSGWQLVYQGSASYNWDMSFVPGSDGLWNTGWILTSDNDILKTTDGGDTWTIITQSETTGLNGICFVDENTGYISSSAGDIIKSTDGGLNWTTIHTGNWFGQIAFKDAMNGSVGGSPNNMYTSDGGATWTDATGPEGYGRMDYGGGDTYYGSGILASAFGKSTDNGQNWTNSTLNHIPVVCEFFNENIGVTGGDSWTIMHTTNGGTSWTESTLNGGSGDFLCAGFFDPDTIYAGGSQKIFKTTDAGSTWVEDTAIAGATWRSMFTTGYNTIFASAEGGNIWRKIGTPPLVANFEANETLICSGTTVDFSDLSIGNITSWSWTFEGGTPSTSSDQNPSVTYNTPGVYYVELEITSLSESSSITKVDYITVLETPAKADIPDGDTDVCTSGNYLYSTNEVLYAQDYDWELSPSTAGTLVEDNNEVTFEVADDYTGDFTINVRATNICGNGDWSDDFAGTVYQSPSEFSLEGGGMYCEGTEGVELTLDGTEIDVDYELELDGVLTGNIVAGTGSAISFGFITEVGYYQAIGFNTSCELYMQNQVSVEMALLPSAPAIPVGPETVCDETSSEYTSSGSDDADSYTWEISPEDAGTLVANDLEVEVTWNSEFEGTAIISISGINECGTGSPSELEVAVGAPIPVISGEEMVCDFSDEIYSVDDNEGSTYSWTVTGGTITEGEGTYMVTVSWDGEGIGNILVDEETVDGCSGTSEQFDVMIDDCTGIGENTESNLAVYPNPAKDILYVSFNSSSTSSLITIYDINGQLAFEREFQGNNAKEQLNVSNLKNGMYLIKVQTGGQVLSTKLFIKN